MSNVTIDPSDPLLPLFAIQHDLRERFLHALEQIVQSQDHESALAIARGVLDPDDTERWIAAGRPLPWLDEIIGTDADALTARVITTLRPSSTA